MPYNLTEYNELQERDDIDKEIAASHAQDELYAYQRCRDAAVDLICALYRANPKRIWNDTVCCCLIDVGNGSFGIYQRDVFELNSCVESIIQWLPENGYKSMREAFDDHFHKPLSALRRTIAEY